MSKRTRRKIPPVEPGARREAGEFRAEAPPDATERLKGEQAAARAIARAEAELPPAGGEFDRAPPDYERP